jgi:hypothetical protein
MLYACVVTQLNRGWYILYTAILCKGSKESCIFLLEYVKGRDDFGFWEDPVQISVVEIDHKVVKWNEVGLCVSFVTVIREIRVNLHKTKEYFDEL